MTADHGRPPRARSLGRWGWLLLVAGLADACIVPPADEPRSRPAYRPTRLPPSRSNPRGSRPFYPTIRTMVLPSGLLVVLEQDMYAQSVGVVSVVRGGFASDPEGAEGLAHLVEHLSFRAVDAGPELPLPLASPGAKRNPLATRREKLIHYAATQINCHTSPDAMTCFEFGPRSRLPWFIELEGARLANPLAGIDQAAIAVERRIIISEHEYRDDPRSGMWASRQLFPLLFPASHPYARLLEASPARIDRLTLAEARAYVAKNFRPDRITLLVTAPTATTEIAEIVKHLPKSLVDAPASGAAHRSDAETAPPLEEPAGPLVRRASPLPIPQLWLGWTLPGWWGAQGPTETLLARWIQQDLDLEQLRQEDAHIRHARVSLLPGLKASALLVRVLLEDGADADHVAQVVAGRVASLWTREPAQRELLHRLKLTALTELILNEPPQFERAVEQAELLAFSPKPELRSDRLINGGEVPTADLAKFAYDHLGQGRRHAVLFTPAEPTDAARASRGTSAPPAARADDLFADAATWEPMELPDPPTPVGNVVVKQLPTGLTVIVARRKAAATTAWLGFRGGYSDANPPLLVELALRIRPDAADAPKYRALSDRGATRDGSIDTLEFVPGDLQPALGLLFKKATAPVQKWPAREALGLLLAQAAPDLDTATEKAAIAFGRALFGEHPLARILRKSDLEKVTRSDVDSWVGRVHNLRNAVLVVVGDVDAAEVGRLAVELSGKLGAPAWVDGISTPPVLTLRRATDEHLVTVVTPHVGALTHVRLGCLLPPAEVADRPAHELLRLAIQERLASALRFDRGAGYAVNVSAESVRGGAAFLQLSTYIEADDLAEALGSLRTQWQRWSRSGFDNGELNVARWLFTGQLSVAFSSGHSVAYRLFTDWIADPASVGPNSFRSNPFATDTARLNLLFATCKANAVLGLTGNEAAIRKALRQSWPQLR